MKHSFYFKHLSFYLLVCFFFVSKNSNSQTCVGNLAQNPSFETGTIANWTADGPATVINGGHAGTTKAVSLCNNGFRIYQTLSATEGKSYTFKVFAKNNGTAAIGTLAIKFLNAAWTPLLSEFGSVTATSTFAEYSVTKVAPAGTVRVEISIIKENGAGCLIADEICFLDNGSPNNNCVITPTVSNIQCTNNNTPNDPSDDLFTFDVVVTQTGTCGTFWVSGNRQAAYGAALNHGPFPIGSGNYTLLVQDGANSNNPANVTAIAPPPCSGGGAGGTCTNNLLQNPSFENNLSSWEGTGGTISTTASAGAKSLKLCQNHNIRQLLPTTAGKNLSVIFKARGETGSTSTLAYIKYLSATFTPLVTEFFNFPVSTTFSQGTFSKLSPTSTAWVEVGFLQQPAACVFIDEICLSEGGVGNPCNILAQISNLQCQDNGTPSNPNDDTFSFNYIVTNGTNTGSYQRLINNVIAETSQYGVPKTYGPSLISAAPLNVNSFLMRDVQNQNCSTVMTFGPPPTCSNGGPIGCGFDKTYANSVPNTFYQPPSAQNLPDGGFKIFGQNIFSPSGGMLNYAELSIDATGTQTNYFSENAISTRTLDGNYIGATFLNPTTLEIKKTNANGTTVIFTKNVAFAFGQTTFLVNPNTLEIAPVADGYVIAVYFAYQPVPNQAPVEVYSVVKTDLLGNKLFQSLGQPVLNFPTFFADFQVGPSGNFYFLTGNSNNYFITKLNISSEQLWSKSVLGDLPSSDQIDWHEAADGHFYTTNLDNQFGHVEKLDGTTGNLIWDFRSSSIPIPNNTTVMGFPKGSISTSDGGALFSMYYSIPGGGGDGTVIGRLSKNGNVLWHKTLSIEYGQMRPILATTDGGYLFAGLKNFSTYAVYKTNSVGDLLPTCGTTGGNLPDLNLTGLSLPNNSIAAGAVLPYNFTARNIGTGNATGNFTIKGYISTDNVLSANDIQDGTINTGNFTTGTSNAVTSGSTIPTTLAAGQYFLIVKIDADNQIAESNENNNTIVSTVAFTVTGGGGGSGADLQVTVTADKTQVGQWTNVVYTFVARNNGTATINTANIKIGGCNATGFQSFSNAFGLVYAGAPGQPTLGNFNSVTQDWTLSNLAAGQSSTLTLTLFSATTGERKVVAFASSQSPTDPDSQPSATLANCTPTQDDEALWTINMGQTLLVTGTRDLTTFEKLSNLDASQIADFQLFPNPAGEVLNVDLTQWIGKTGKLIFINQLGKVIFEKTFENISSPIETIDLSNFINGQYFVKMETAGQRTQVKRLVVSRMY
jgi:CARDB/Domain of unknown function DUF11/Secretion system C-terminal sorting domain